MKRLLAGTLLGGAVLFAWSAATGQAALPGLAGSLLSAFLATLLLLQLGPRSAAEKILFLLTAALLAWSGRLGAAGAQSRGTAADLAHLLAAWTLAGCALAWLVHPRSE